MRNTCVDVPYQFMKGPSYSPQVLLPNEPFACQQPTMIEVLCTSVENAITFYGCPVSHTDELRSVIAKVNNLCSSYGRLGKKPTFRGIYAALFEEDQSWYRCIVVHSTIPSKPGMCRVFYIDFGNQEEVSYNNIVMLPEAAQKIPPLAVRCTLTNLVCELPKGPSNVTYLHHLVNQRMSLSASYNPAIPEYEVHRCSCNGIDVISEIVKKGFASYKTTSTSAKSPCTAAKPIGMNLKMNPKDDIKAPMSNGVKCNGVHVPSSKEIKAKLAGPNKTNDKNKDTKNIPEVKSKNLNKEVKPKTTKKNETKTENAPKMIIKRGSEISEVLGTPQPPVNSSDTVIEKSYLLKMDSVLSNLKLTNNIRDLVSFSTDDSIINDAVKFLVDEMKIEYVEDLKEEVLEEASKMYSEILDEIRNCTSQELLTELKSRRDLQRDVLFNALKEYMESFDMSILERRTSMQKLIMDLESNSNAWMNVYLEGMPETVKDLLLEYQKIKDSRRTFIQNARENSNEKHKYLMDCLNALQQEFFLHSSSNESTEAISNPPSIPKSTTKETWVYKLEKTLSELGKALEAEIESFALSKGNGNISVIQCILDKLDIPKEKLDVRCMKYEKYLEMYKRFETLPNLELIFSKLATVQEKIKIFHHHLMDSLFVEKNALNETFDGGYTYDKGKSDVLQALHEELLEEDELMAIITSAYETHFPELDFEHPDLKLKECQFSRNLLKNNWKSVWFLCEKLWPKLEFSYLSSFLKEPTVIKEYTLEDNVRQRFLQKAVIWNDIKSDLLVKISALFYKDEKTICAIIPCVWNSLNDMPCISIPSEGTKACQILRLVLKVLRDIHSQEIFHGALHPASIMYEGGRILLDFCFDTNLQGKSIVRGLDFQPQFCKQASEDNDMYSFGCLVLWMLFPNLLFTSTDAGVPDICAFRSIIEEMLSTNDYMLLSNLVGTDMNMRPSASKLLNCGFLNDYESFCKQRCGNLSNMQ
ncbi:serine/threonine-protein kinase 31-like [Uloborus diversus]|uniref:serine/threonine-protein kinase 31-like n=1 Tax=Uloborus diversus TaxID=327109 RepID=UPI0024092FF8|nr:serine/threonine-protein kinase 31-like [Uloborus diversus]